MPRDYKGRPRNIPSQNRAPKTPYFPGPQADQEQFAKLRGDIPHGYTPSGAFTVATYDSRLINTIEFFKSFFLQQNFGISGARLIAEAGFTVPEGRTCVLREWSFEPSFGVPGALSNTSYVSVEGFPNANFKLDFLVNGSAVPEVSDIQTGAPCFSGISGETFIIVAQGNRIALKASIVDLPNGLPSGTGLKMTTVDMSFSGQFILSEGHTPDFEIGNNAAVPVDVKTKGVAI